MVNAEANSMGPGVSRFGIMSECFQAGSASESVGSVAQMPSPVWVGTIRYPEWLHRPTAVGGGTLLPSWPPLNLGDYISSSAFRLGFTPLALLVRRSLHVD